MLKVLRSFYLLSSFILQAALRRIIQIFLIKASYPVSFLPLYVEILKILRVLYIDVKLLR